MDPALWNRESDKIATTVTPEALSVRSARQDFRDMGIKEEDRPAAEWTDLRRPAQATKKVNFGSKGKEPVQSAVRAGEAEHGDGRSGSDSTNEPLMFGSIQGDPAQTLWDSAESARYIEPEQPTTPTPTKQLLEKNEAKAGVDDTDKSKGEASEDVRGGSTSSAPTGRLNRKSILAASKKGIAKVLPKKKPKPQY